MMDDPILLAATAFALIMIPVMSVSLGKIKLKFVYIPPLLSMIIAFPMFFFVLIVPGLPISFTLFVISMSLWTGGFFGLFTAFLIHLIKRDKYPR